MEEALSLKRLKERVNTKYEKDEQRVVGIMLARYDLNITRALVNECYQYWHKNTGNEFDIFWIGYGAYLPEDEESDTKIIMDFRGNVDRAYYDLDAFIDAKRELTRVLDYSYNDCIQLLLVNYYNGKLHFKESFQIDLEQNLDENMASIRKVIEWLTEECCREGNVQNVLHKLRMKGMIEKIKGISINEVFDKAVGVAGLIIK